MSRKRKTSTNEQKTDAPARGKSRRRGGRGGGGRRQAASPSRDNKRQEPRRQPTPREPLIGTVSAHPDGFGFVDVPGIEKGFFLPHEEMRDLMQGDVVEVRQVRRRGRASAEVVRIVQAASSTIVGQYLEEAGAGLVRPRSRRFTQDVLVRRKDRGGAKPGDWVRIDIRRGSRPLSGRITEVLGQELTPKDLIDIIIGELELPGGFPAAVLRECEAIPDEVDETAIAGRKDLRHLHFVTIDGEDARDFDDAICVLPRGEGFEAWVAIADVAHYVHPGSALDAEALERSNSFYFPDRVIPMLPEKLSNGLCSLNPDVPRLAMAVRMRFDAAGKRRSVQAYDAVIHSRARLTYAQAARWIDERDKAAIKDAATRDMLDHAARLHEKLARRRRLRGALDLDVPEVRAVLHEGRIADLGRTERNTAHHLIEELMLAANTAVAEYMESKSCPLLYRVHPAPEEKAIEQLNDFLAPFGLHIRIPKKGAVRPGDIQDILDAAKDKPFAHVLHRLVLRSMQQARYTPDNEGHFGLAFRSYCHFTSPIRRYADLTVHRRLKALIHGRNPDKAQPAKELAAIGERTSTQERKQQRGEWDVQAMFAALYHEKDVGRVLPARISGMSKRRLFVEFEETLAEGSMGVEELGEGFELDESGHRLVARRGGASHTLGDEILVRIVRVDPVRGQIDVTLAGED